MTSISFPQITGWFLPKVANEYNLIEEFSDRSSRINHTSTRLAPSVISNTLFSNNQINTHDYKQESTSEKKKKKSPLSYVELGLITTVTAIITAVGLGRLKSSITTTKENIGYSEVVTASFYQWNQARYRDNIYNIALTYRLAEMKKEEKMLRYQNSLIGMSFGIGAYVIGAFAGIELLPIAGIVTTIASLVFGAYHAAIHWDDFTRTQNELKNLKLLEVVKYYNPIPDTIQKNNPSPSAPPPPGWKLPPY